jgi:hypothetical protein
MNWERLNLKFTTQNEQLLFIGLCIVTGLLLIGFIRIIVLLRQRRRMEERTERLEGQILDQQKELMAGRADSAAWRGEMQRQFDGFRSDSTRRCGEAELRAQDLQRRLDEAAVLHERKMFETQAALDAARRMCAELPTAKARILELEAMIMAPLETPCAADTNGMHAVNADEMKSLAVAAKAVSTLPVLPSMEALEIQDESRPAESDAARGDLATIQQRNAELQRALLLARRRKVAMRTKPRGR